MTKRWTWIALAALACGAESGPHHAGPQRADEEDTAEQEDPRLGFHFAGLEADPARRVSVVDERVVIDGITTDIVAAPMSAVYPLDRGRALVLARPLAVWDPSTSRATRLPEDVSAEEVRGTGYVLVRHGYRDNRYVPIEIGDLDPESFQFRPLYSGAEVAPIGLYRDGLLVRDAASLVLVRPGRAPESLPIGLEGHTILPDALRGDRLLALRIDERAVFGPTALHAPPPGAVVSVLDLERSTWRDLGHVTGCVWALHMNCCNQSSGLHVRWAPSLPPNTQPGSEACAHVVLETDESVHALTDPPPA